MVQLLRFSQRLTYSAALAIPLVLSGCGDPYEKKLPNGGSPTIGQAEKLAENLPETDRKIFIRWAKRIAAGDRMSAEVTPYSVRHAIVNQNLYEAKVAEEVKKQEAAEHAERAKRKKLEDEALAKVERARAFTEHRAKVDSKIKELVFINIVSWENKPTFNAYGYEVDRNFVFHMKLKNNTNEDITGIAGWVTFHDQFGSELGTYPARMEPTIPAGKEISYIAYLPFDRKNENHGALLASNRIGAKWFLESVVFKSGQRVDAQSLTSPNAPSPVNSGTKART